MERVRGGRIGSLRPVSERALAGRGSPALVSGAACGAGRLCTGRLHVRGIPAASGFAACCRPVPGVSCCYTIMIRDVLFLIRWLKAVPIPCRNRM